MAFTNTALTEPALQMIKDPIMLHYIAFASQEEWSSRVPDVFQVWQEYQSEVLRQDILNKMRQRLAQILKKKNGDRVQSHTDAIATCTCMILHRTH